MLTELFEIIADAIAEVKKKKKGGGKGTQERELIGQKQKIP